MTKRISYKLLETLVQEINQLEIVYVILSRYGKNQNGIYARIREQYSPDIIKIFKTVREAYEFFIELYEGNKLSMNKE